MQTPEITRIKLKDSEDRQEVYVADVTANEVREVLEAKFKNRFFSEKPTRDQLIERKIIKAEKKEPVAA